jgi:hypothetical protein
MHSRRAAESFMRGKATMALDAIPSRLYGNRDAPPLPLSHACRFREMSYYAGLLNS